MPASDYRFIEMLRGVTQRGVSPVFNRTEVHLWSATIPSTANLDELARFLSDDETARAKTFHFDLDRRRFIFRRAILRVLLSRYLELQPSAIRFSYNEFGKPALGNQDRRDLKFNSSDSGDLLEIAIASDREVGIDIELLDGELPLEEIATRFFSPNEVAQLKGLPQSLRQAGFFNCWTRKEAYIKGRGMGLSIPLESFDVSVKPGEPPDLIHSKEDCGDKVWKVASLEINTRYALAIAAPGSDWTIVRHRLLI